MGVRTLRFAEECGFPPSSRFFAGHFPGNPVVPGAVILGHVAAGLAGHELAVRTVRRVKFLRPLPPGVPIETVVEERDGDARFTVSGPDGVFATGSLTLGALR